MKVIAWIFNWTCQAIGKDGFFCNKKCREHGDHHSSDTRIWKGDFMMSHFLSWPND